MALNLVLPDKDARDGDAWALAEAGALIRSLRHRTGLHQWELARNADTRQSFISKAERGKDLKLSTLITLADALGFELVLQPRKKSLSGLPRGQ